MIVGNGLIASLFKNNDLEDVIFFASGVSNSLEKDIKQFLREENLIRKTILDNKEKLFIYFSTCSIYDSSKVDSPYVLHKLKMEQLIKDSCEHYLIQRVSNVVGNGGNPNLLMNYLIRSVKKAEKINVHTKATRNLIDADDVKKITFKNIEEQNLNKTINVAYLKNYSIIEILESIEKYYKINLNLNLIKKGCGYEINIPDIKDYFLEKNLENKEKYIVKILESYYPL